MNAKQWDTCTDPEEMLSNLEAGGKASERKLRLFATGVVRGCWPLLATEAAFRAVELAERFADGTATEEELDVAWSHLRHLPEYLPDHAVQAAAMALGSRAAARERLYSDEDDTHEHEQVRMRYDLGTGVVWASVEAFSQAAGNAARDEAGGPSAGMVAVRARDAARAEAARRHRERLCGLIHDIFVPFRPMTPLSPSLLGWEKGLVVRLAEAAYAERELPSGHLDDARLAVLADALEDAGCTDDRLLAHLRSPGPHLRGCWAVDAVLGKS